MVALHGTSRRRKPAAESPEKGGRHAIAPKVSGVSREGRGAISQLDQSILRRVADLSF